MKEIIYLEEDELNLTAWNIIYKKDWDVKFIIDIDKLHDSKEYSYGFNRLMRYILDNIYKYIDDEETQDKIKWDILHSRVIMNKLFYICHINSRLSNSDWFSDLNCCTKIANWEHFIKLARVAAKNNFDVKTIWDLDSLKEVEEYLKEEKDKLGYPFIY